MPMEAPSLPPDFREFLQFLNDEGVEYLLIGGWAVGVHGVIRYTQDMDVWVATSGENVQRILKALERFGFSHGEASAELFLEPGNIVRMGFPPMRIEISTQIDGVAFAECYPRRLMTDMDGIEIPVICLEDLLANKRASNRLKDQADVEALTQ
ncbi:MAG: nucleotidyltransferase [Prosthecobacter sp.]|nr:nucleotidyltransferase [Prosthecobacter sp.]